MEEALVGFLLLEVEQGKRADNFFKGKTWDDAVPVVNALLEKDWIPLTGKKIQQKYENLKRNYDSFNHIRLHLSGFGWDEETQTSTCDDETWAEYVAVHKNAAKYRKKGLHNYEQLQELFDGLRATGEHARSGRKSKRKLSVSSGEDEESTPKDLADNSIYPEFDSQLLNPDKSTPSTPRAISPTKAASIPATETNTPAGSSFTPRVAEASGKRGNVKCVREKKSGSSQLASALVQVSDTAKEIQRRKIEGVRFNAMTKLQQEHKELKGKTLIRAFKILEDAAKAEIFLAIQDSEARQEWLEYELEVQ